MKRMPQPILYQGSKRNIAAQILSLLPGGIETLIEPFAGSAAVSIRAAYAGLASAFHLNDLNRPLMDLLYLSPALTGRIESASVRPSIGRNQHAIHTLQRKKRAERI